MLQNKTLPPASLVDLKGLAALAFKSKTEEPDMAALLASRFHFRP